MDRAGKKEESDWPGKVKSKVVRYLYYTIHIVAQCRRSDTKLGVDRLDGVWRVWRVWRV